MRKYIIGFGLGLTLATICFYAGSISQQTEAKADISEAVGRKRYTPTFKEWVEVYMLAHYGQHERLAPGFNNISASMKPDGISILPSKKFELAGKRFVISIMHSDDKRGNADYKLAVHRIKKDLELRTALWRQDGYNIAVKDFEISTIAVPPDIIKKTLKLTQ